MRRPNPELEKQIKTKTLELLMEKDPLEIGMRDIAAACGVTATSIYHYFKDKNDVFRNITRDCMEEFGKDMVRTILDVPEPGEKIVKALQFFRDWSFANPKKAFLVMGKVESDPEMTLGNLDSYYGCHKLLKELLLECNQGMTAEQAVLKANLIISSLWGCISSIISERTEPEYWHNGVEFTDKAIELLLGNSNISQNV